MKTSSTKGGGETAASFVKLLKDIKYPKAHLIKPESVEWLLATKSIASFFSFLLAEVRPEHNVVDDEEIRR